MTLEKVGAVGTIVACALGGASYGSSSLNPPRRVLEVTCDNPQVVVHAPSRSDVQIACDGARDAEVFLASQRFDVSGPVAIDIVHRLPAVASESAAGCYLAAENRVVVLGYAEFRKRETWFNIPLDRVIYRSLVAHEVAHSIAAANFRVPEPTIQAHEYIAYVTMLATMAPPQRTLVLAQYPGDGFANDAAMNSTIYLFDPMRFGVQAYRHFLKQTNGREYLRAVLTGNALAE